MNCTWTLIERVPGGTVPALSCAMNLLERPRADAVTPDSLPGVPSNWPLAPRKFAVTTAWPP